MRMNTTQLSILGLLGASLTLAAPTAMAICTIDSECKEQFGCEPCARAYALGITGTTWQNRSYADINGDRTTYRTRRTSAGNGGGLVVDTTQVGSSFHTVSGSIACTGNTTSPSIRHTSVRSETVFCPPGRTPTRADTYILVPDRLCPDEQICGFN